MIPAFPVYLFDVDGTLVDSAADICGAVRDTLAGSRHAAIGDDFLRRYIGLHLADLYQDLFPAYSPDQVEELIETYRRVYPLRKHGSTRVYAGVAETLAALGGRKSTATTKRTWLVKDLLEQFGLAQYFDHLQGTDGFPAKPAPDVILTSLAALGARPEDCLMVGDAPADMEAGHRAGVKTCAVRYGYGDAAEMARYQPDYWIGDPRELLG
ncbi:MAG: HAD-IA family hydrolase [Acidobacteria bacterium]|nr:HAD-IA family hydrolase [Acidobacteriota bacterium]